MSEIDNRIAALQADIRSEREALERIKPDARGYGAALERVIKATSALIAFERHLPTIVAEPTRRRSEQIITWVIYAFTGVILVLGLIAALGVSSRWWLLLLVPAAGFGLWLLWFDPVEVTVTHHLTQRMGAVLLVLAAVLAVIVVIGLPAEWTFVGVVMIAACLTWSFVLLYRDDELQDEP
jgi:hypothetical protein